MAAMARIPLIRFRYAIDKAAKAGMPHPFASMQNVSESATKAPATATASNPIPSPPGVTRTATRIEKAVPRATLTDEEMDAIMLGGAL